MEKRAFNCQEAPAYLGVKSLAFDLHFRPYLTAVRMGTAVVFDRVNPRVLET